MMKFFLSLRILVLGALLLLVGQGAFAQADEIALAKEYFRKQEYEKAESIFEKLSRNDQVFATIYPEYLKTTLALRKYKDAEKLVKKAIKKSPDQVNYQVDLGLVYQAAGNEANAAKYFNKLIDGVNNNALLAMANAFEQNNLLEYAEKTYLQGRKLSKNESEFTGQLMQLYSYQRQSEKLINEILNLVKVNPNQLLLAQNMLQNSLKEEKEFEALEKSLISNLQKYPDQVAYSEMLIWLYIQRKDFFSALMQARSLDKRTKGGGGRVMELGAISLKNKDYESAIEAYDYITKEYRTGPFYEIARERAIKAREEQVRNTYPVDLTKIKILVGEYESLLNELGKGARTVEIMKNMAGLYAFYLDDKEKASTMLEEVINTPRANPDIVADAKITLGDIFLLKSEPWEATLLYSQVEKTHKDMQLGHEAKLRNAKLSYYKGDFELAQEHLDILKLATSREIANDAMDLSLLITDNTGLDSSTTALTEYAATELLIFQNKQEEAQAKLDQMLRKYQDHSLTDEIYFLKANIYLKAGDFQRAVTNLGQIVGNPQYDILSDDALFLLAKIYEENLNDKEKAKELYNSLLVKYPGSIFTVDARKRFRKLRGDVIN
ncbi:tetratricopeptide repeat protein [Adhaeribacter rhizoryzae]|uniref:Tetratricopeptide repeat protein n=1 Tax=Adhaeribacter rhizoryzae TaxID=2607907 RepID=A0A5M6DJ47_9BACT|nr:tetratricopeptide repeat protein [Adhaeribacter rhizoryzae]KAA5546396.1 tetratricopeptide repeat protein [Adhaeribacter rhizoryzae]